MRKDPRRVLKLSKTDQTSLYCDVVRSFVTNYCGGFSWQSLVLGLLRARDFTRLLDHAELVNLQLICSCTRDETTLTEYGSARLFQLASQYVALVTKYQFTSEEIPGLDPDARALEDFLQTERRNRRLNIVFRGHLDRRTERHWCIPLIRDVFCRVLGRTPPYEDIFNNCDYSGGACVGLSGDATHMANKLCAKNLTGSTQAFYLFKDALRRNFHYSAVLLDSLGDRHLPTMSEEALQLLFQSLDSRFVEVGYDEIKVVPKKAKSGRTIGKNPPVNNLVQKGVDKVMRSLLKRHLNLNLADQVTNQVLSHKGSDPDVSDPYVTIDVRGASNSVLTELVRSVTPPRWFKLLDHLRSHEYVLPLDPVKRKYEMFVSMGNGFCFPLESLLFASICIAAYKYAGAIPDYRVYGDDIIVRQSVALVVMECLNACGFRTNVDKTYVFGPFRESCGANWYDGGDVTPGYLKERLTTEAALHVLHNSLAGYPEVQGVLLKYVASRNKLVHVVPDSEGYGWVTDQAFRVPYDVAIAVDGVTWDRDTKTFVYPVLVTSPVVDEDWQQGNCLSDSTVDKLRLAAALRGSTYEEPFHLRRTTKTRSERSDCAAVAEMRKLAKKLRAVEAFVGPHRYDYTQG